jgi:hypothetical protein
MNVATCVDRQHARRGPDAGRHSEAEFSVTMSAAGSRGRHVLRPVWPDIGAAVATAGTDHARAERPDNRFVGQVIGIHDRLMIAG